MTSHLMTRKMIIIAGVICSMGISMALQPGILPGHGIAAKLISASAAEGAEDITVRSTGGGENQTSVNIQTFISYAYDDPMVGMEAFRLLIPKGWQAEGSISWSANIALPAQSQFRFYDPNGIEEFDIFPTQSYFWTDNQVFLYTNPLGSLRFGTLVASPIDLQSAFRDVIIPSFRGHAGDLKIVEEQEVPELAQMATGEPVPGVNAAAEGGKIRIEYQQNGAWTEEEIYAAVSQFVTYLPGSALSGSYFINYWYIDYIFSFRAPKGMLDSRSKTFQTMVYSLKVNPQYFAKIANTKEILAQMAIEGIEATGYMSEVISNASSKLREDQQRAWEQRQEVQDRIVQNLSDYVRGVERYHDPHAGKEVELPSGYGHAWANDLGEYIVTDSQSYNPNIGSNLHWEQMTPAK
jgi:hypothetical protein